MKKGNPPASQDNDVHMDINVDLAGNVHLKKKIIYFPGNTHKKSLHWNSYFKVRRSFYRTLLMKRCFRGCKVGYSTTKLHKANIYKQQLCQP